MLFKYELLLLVSFTLFFNLLLGYLGTMVGLAFGFLLKKYYIRLLYQNILS